MRLWVQDADGKSPARQISPAAYHIKNVVWMRSGQGFVVSATTTPGVEAWSDRIYSVSLAGAFTEVAAPKGPFSRLSMSPDGKTVGFVGSRIDGPIPHDLYIVPVQGGAAKNLTATSIDRPVMQYVWKDNNTLQALVQTGFRSKFYTVMANGNATPLAE